MNSQRPPDRKELRRFGLIMGAAVALMLGIVVPWLAHFTFPAWPWYIAAVFVGLGLLWPPALKPMYISWMLIGRVLNWLVSRAALVLVYYALVVPTGVVRRLLKKDPMKRRFERDAMTYRTPLPTLDRKHVEKPF